ncbi:MAG: rhombosortase [Mariprofundaceae bacterium]|nr:rhombosortase [Mariprofundaceae bacterium]
MAISLLCLVATVSPDVFSLFVFDRSAIEHGELWRIFSCHFAHFSPLHLIYNLLVFSIAAAIIEINSHRKLIWLYIWLSIVISCSLFIIKPDMVYYAGLSGVSCGILYYCALMGLQSDERWQNISLIIIVIIPAKLLFEVISDGSALPYLGASFVPMHSSHIIGCSVAVLFYLYESQKRRKINGVRLD